MGFYLGNEPAKVATKVGVGVITATELADDSITTADIVADAITPIELSESATGYQVGSLGVATAVSGTHKLVVGGTASFTGAITGDLTGNVTGNATGQAGTVATIAGLAPNTATTQATQGAITSLGILTSLTVDTIGINASTITGSGDLIFDVASDIVLDADGGKIKLHDGGTAFGQIFNNSGLHIISKVSDQDIVFKGQDGVSEITALTLDMSDAGKAIFTGQVQATSFITGDLILKSPTNNGHYTIWEEEEYLAIRNEMTGKKYKFVLEEINE